MYNKVTAKQRAGTNISCASYKVPDLQRCPPLRESCSEFFTKYFNGAILILFSISKIKSFHSFFARAWPWGDKMDSVSTSFGCSSRLLQTCLNLFDRFEGSLNKLKRSLF